MNAYGLKILKNGDRYYLYEEGGYNQRGGVREITDSGQLQQMAQQYDIPVVDFTGKPWTSDYLSQQGFGAITTGKANIGSSEIGKIFSQYDDNKKSIETSQEQERLAKATNDFIAANKNTKGIIDVPSAPGYVMKDGVFMMKSSIPTVDYEAEVAAGRMKRVPIGSGFGYIPTGSPADQQLNGGGGQQSGGGGASPTPGGGLQVPNASNNDALKAVYNKRPDLQQVYNADGTAKDPNDPRVAGIPTLFDWANKFGVNEEPTLKPVINSFNQGGGGQPGQPGQQGGSAITSTPSNVKFKETAAYKNLDPASQELVDMAFNLVSVGGEEEAKMFAAAISQAKNIADPYFRSQLALIQGEIGSKIAELNNDFQTQADIIDRTRKELLADVGASKEFLTMEQQAELARLGKEYDGDILKIKDAAAEKGITFASGYMSGDRYQQVRSEAYQDVVESSGRKYNFQINQLTNQANRGDVDAAKKLEALTGKKTIALQNLGRAAEAKIGSALVPTATGYTPVGGVTGELEETKAKSILSDVGAFMDLQKGFI